MKGITILNEVLFIFILIYLQSITQKITSHGGTVSLKYIVAYIFIHQHEAINFVIYAYLRLNQLLLLNSFMLSCVRL